MATRLSEAEISRLLAERKSLPPDYRERIQTKPKHGHKERELDVTGADGSEFRLIFRQSEFNPLDFSVILAYRPPKKNQLFRLRRYNGKSHEHTNTFADFRGAIRAMLEDCGFDVPPDTQGTLFEEEL